MNLPQSAFLQFFGSPSVFGKDGTRLTGPSAQRHRVALLALLSTSPSRGMSREKLIGYLWPDRDTEHARQLLNQAVYNLRKTLGEEALLSAADDLVLNAQVIRSDVEAFNVARDEANDEQVVAVYTGPFLDGFFLPEASEFDLWKERERERLRAAYARSLETLAEQAAGRQDFPLAVERWRALASMDPFDSRLALRYMEALESSGNRAGALQHAAIHQRLLSEEFGTAPTPEVLAFAERLRHTVAPLPAIDPRGNVPGDEAPPATPRRLTPAVNWRTAAWSLGGALAVVAIVATLMRDRSPAEAAPSSNRAPAGRSLNVAANEFYRRASDPVLLRSDSAARTGLELFQQAIALDSTFAAAWAGMARMYMRVSGSLPRPQRAEYMALGGQAARRAIALDDGLAEAHGTVGVTMMMSFDFDGAERHLKRAIELDPTVAVTHEWIVTNYLWMGRNADAIAHGREALRLSPLSPSAHAELARALAHAGQSDEALEHLDAITALNPPLLRAAAIRAHCYAIKGMWNEAVAAIRPQANQRMWGWLGFMLARSGQREEAVRIRSRLRDQASADGNNLFDDALITAGLGQLDEAIDLLDQAIAGRVMTGGPGPADVFIMGPLFDDLRQRPSFQRVRARLGLTAEGTTPTRR